LLCVVLVAKSDTVAVGVGIGLCFGVVLAFGDELADALEK
jgi:hypothetical protein